MAIQSAYAVPHPPVLLEAVGGPMTHKVWATRDALGRVAAEIAETSPDVVVVMSPHGDSQPGAVSVALGEEVLGSFAAFGHGHISSRFNLSPPFRDALVEAFDGETELEAQPAEIDGLDHGCLVPLMLVLSDDVPLVVLSVAWAAAARHACVGRAIRRAAAATGLKAVFIASGDLSHRLTPGAPAGFHPAARVFDESVCEIFSSGELSRLLSLDEELAELAGECGLRSLAALAGCFEGLTPEQIDSEVLSYEGPFGVGYMVARVREA